MGGCRSTFFNASGRRLGAPFYATGCGVRSTRDAMRTGCNALFNAPRGGFCTAFNRFLHLFNERR